MKNKKDNFKCTYLNKLDRCNKGKSICGIFCNKYGHCFCCKNTNCSNCQYYNNEPHI